MNQERQNAKPVQITNTHELVTKHKKLFLQEGHNQKWSNGVLPQLLGHEWGKDVMHIGFAM